MTTFYVLSGLVIVAAAIIVLVIRKLDVGPRLPPPFT